MCRAVLLNLESIAMKSDYHSSISVNSLLIYDPSEGTENRNHDAGVNVGGQRMPIYDQPKDLSVLLDPANKYRVGSVVAHGWGSAANVQAEEEGVAVADWHWLAGSITDAYCANKTKHVSRSSLDERFGRGRGIRGTASLGAGRKTRTLPRERGPRSRAQDKGPLRTRLKSRRKRVSPVSRLTYSPPGHVQKRHSHFAFHHEACHNFVFA